MAQDPFWNIPSAMVLDFFEKVIEKYSTRFVFSLNVYPYFDPGNGLDAGSKDKCSAALHRGLCWNDPKGCLFASVSKDMRRRMGAVSSTDNVLWITETGWSSPASSTLAKNMQACDDFSSEESFKTYYSGFLSWDLE